MQREGDLVRIALSDVRHDQNGFAQLARLHSLPNECFLEDIAIAMENASWFDADMCAVFGAILCSIGNELNAVHLANIPSDVQHILSRNRFLSHYGKEELPDRWRTTVSYQRFDVSEVHRFANYIKNEYADRPELPEMSPALLRKV